MRWPVIALPILACVGLTTDLSAARIIRDSLDTKLVSAGKVEYGVLVHDDYEASGERLPLVLMLHGAGGDREQLARFESQIDGMWASDELPRMVFVTPSVASGSIYLDSYDGKERWETFIMQELLPHIRREFHVSSDRKTTMVTGISMGGFGSLGLGFKHPDVFGAIAAMEPGAWPGLTWDEVPDRNKIRSAERIASLFGDPFDHDAFARENPASIADANPSRLEDTAIYLEVGDEDGFGFVEGVDFMHRLLWKHRVPHEFRLVRWADHIGSSITERSHNRFRFLARHLDQPAAPEPAVTAYRKRMAASQESRGMEPFGFWPNSTLRSYDSGDGEEDYERALRDSEELRKATGIIRIANVPYVDQFAGDPERQQLDIYLQEGLKDAPIVLYVHGGGWVQWSKNRSMFKPVGLVPRGYLFASMNYRFRPSASLDEMSQDVANAVAWLRSHGAKYGGDGSRITLMGHSAGAHLVTVVGSNSLFLERSGLSLSDLRGVVALDTAMLDVPARMKTVGASQRRVFGTDPEAWTPFSPIHHVKPGIDMPPLLLLTADGREVTRVQAEAMIKTMRGADVEVEHYEAKGRSHTPLDTYIGTKGDAATRVLLDFLTNQMAK